MNFIPTKNFDSSVTRSTYVKGQKYVVRQNGAAPFDDGEGGKVTLAQLVKKWEGEGKVTIGSQDASGVGV